MGIFLFLIIAVAVTKISGRTFSAVAGLTASAIIALLYASGIAGNLCWGMYLVTGAAGASLIYLLLRALKRREKLRRLDVGLIVFVFLMFFFSLADLGLNLYGSDEWERWALVVKNFVYYDSFTSNPMATVHTNYPPGTSLWEYFGTRFWFTCSERLEYLSLQSLMLSYSLPFYEMTGTAENGEKRQPGVRTVIRWAVITFLILLAPSISGGSFLYLVPDALMGILVAYCFISFLNYVRTGDRFYVLCVYSAVFMLLMSKRGALILTIAVILGLRLLESLLHRQTLYRGRCALWCSLVYVFTICSWHITLMVQGGGKEFQDEYRKALEYTAVLFICFAFFEIALRLFFKNRRVFALLFAGFFAAGAAAVSFLARTAFLGEKFTYAVNMLQTYCDGIFTTEYAGYGYFFQISLFSVLFGTFLAAVIMWRKLRSRAGNEYSLDNVLAPLTLLTAELSCVLYLALLYMNYVAIIGPGNGPVGKYLPSFCRYVCPCVLAMLLLVVYCAYEVWGDRGYAVDLLLSAALILTADVGQIPRALLNETPELKYWALDHSKIEIEPEDKFYLVNQKWESNDDIVGFMYNVFPGSSDKTNDNLHEKGEREKPLISAEEFSKRINNYTYVYINELDDVDAFVEQYGEMFEDPSGIDDCTLYYIDRTGSEPVLEQIGK